MKVTTEQELTDLFHKTFFMLDGILDITQGKISVFGKKSKTQMVSLLNEIPMKFDIIANDFICDARGLTSLRNSPDRVGNEFNCSSNLLTNLQFGPRKTKYYDLSNNLVTSLQGIPKGTLAILAAHNNLTDLQGLPDGLDYLDISHNPSVTFKGLPKMKLGSDLIFTYRKNLPLLPLVGQLLYLKTGRKAINELMSKYCQLDKNSKSGILDCQRDLITAGFATNARFY